MKTSALSDEQLHAAVRAKGDYSHVVLAQRLRKLIDDGKRYATTSVCSATVKAAHLGHLADMGALSYQTGPGYEVWRFNDRTAAWVEAVAGVVA